MAIREIQGLSEFKRDTDKIEKDLPKRTQEASLEIAREWLNAAQGYASTPQQQLAAQSLTMSDAGDHVTIDSDSPIFYGAEFGGQSRPETMHFPPYLGREGYFFYPARRENDENFNDLWEKAIDDAMKPWDHKEF